MWQCQYRSMWQCQDWVERQINFKGMFSKKLFGPRRQIALCLDINLISSCELESNYTIMYFRIL